MSIRIVDAHQHVFWNSLDDHGLVKDIEEHGIDLTWLLTWEIAPDEDNRFLHADLNPAVLRADGTHPGILLQDLLRARDHYPGLFLLGYCPHPLAGDAPALLRAAVAMYGVRVCGEWKFRTLIDDPRSLELFRTAGELKLPVVIHLDVPYLANVEGEFVYDERWYGGTIENLERALKACPETNFIGHAPGFWREISGDAATASARYPKGPVVTGGGLYGLFDRNPNLYADLSGGSGRFALQRDPQHALRFIERYQDRLLFGRDLYGQELHQFLQTLGLPEAIEAKIYSGNAERLVAGTNV